MSGHNSVPLLDFPVELLLSVIEQLGHPTDLLNLSCACSALHSSVQMSPLLLYKRDAQFQAKNADKHRRSRHVPSLLWAIRNLDDLEKLEAIVEIFQEAFGSTSIDDKWDVCIETPVQAAIKAHRLDVFQLLVKKGLGLRCGEDSEEFVDREPDLRKLSDYNTIPEIRFWEPETWSFDLACSEGQDDMALWMIEYFSRERGIYPGPVEMECAVRAENPKVVRALLSGTPYFTDPVYDQQGNVVEPGEIHGSFLHLALTLMELGEIDGNFHMSLGMPRPAKPEIVEIFLEAGAHIIFGTGDDAINLIVDAILFRQEGWTIKLLKTAMDMGPISERALLTICVLDVTDLTFLEFFCDNFLESPVSPNKMVSTVLLDREIMRLDRMSPKFAFLMDAGCKVSMTHFKCSDISGRRKFQSWYEVFELFSVGMDYQTVKFLWNGKFTHEESRLSISYNPANPDDGSAEVQTQIPSVLASLCVRAMTPNGLEDGDDVARLFDQIRSTPDVEPDFTLFAPIWEKVHVSEPDAKQELNVKRLEAIFRFALSDDGVKKLLLERLASIGRGDEDEELEASNEFFKSYLSKYPEELQRGWTSGKYV
ncbi:hypothetical protein F5B20DRAFT_591757 [Whalleya microplaca]|nr:hypothetical protein F5B20DRAFT_591757 [Whalleya microplaca]